MVNIKKTIKVVKLIIKNWELEKRGILTKG